MITTGPSSYRQLPRGITGIHRRAAGPSGPARRHTAAVTRDDARQRILLLGESLAELLDADEVASLARWCLALARRGRMPVPSGSWPSIPWPAF